MNVICLVCESLLSSTSEVFNSVHGEGFRGNMQRLHKMIVLFTMTKERPGNRLHRLVRFFNKGT